MTEVDASFLDMDGVLVDFVYPACRLHGVTDPYPATKHPDSYDTWTHLGMTADAFWKPISEAGSGFWETLPRLKKADEWVQFCKDSGKPWCILTKVSGRDWEQVVLGKHRWLMRNYGPSIAARMVPCADKSLHSGIGKLLIDDCQDNIDAWIAAGGRGAMPARPWNRSDWGDEELIALLRS